MCFIISLTIYWLQRRVKLLIMNVNFLKSKKGKTKQWNHFGAFKSNYMSLKVFVVCGKFSTAITYLESII